MAIDIRLAADRFVTRTDSVVSRHSFSYGPHYDPSNTRFGPLVAHNDDVLSPQAAFPEHPHRDVEIITWVISGALRHTDSSGGSGRLTPGVVGLLSTGAGVRHVEANDSGSTARYVQMWVMPHAAGPPSFARCDVSAALEDGRFAVVAGGPDAPVSIRGHGARFVVARLPAGRSEPLPSAPMLHVFVARGSVALAGHGLAPVLVGEGDAVRITDVPELNVEASADAEVLVWAFEGEPARPNTTFATG